jgi:hypothetical protein
MALIPGKGGLKKRGTSPFASSRTAFQTMAWDNVRGMSVKGMKKKRVRIIPLTIIPLTSLRDFPILLLRFACRRPRWAFHLFTMGLAICTSG